MPEREVVSNTSPLLYLHQVGQLDLLHRLYGRVVVPSVKPVLEALQDRTTMYLSRNLVDWVLRNAGEV